MNIKEERICQLNKYSVNKAGKYVLYWMQQAQRPYWNHALEFAVHQSNELNLPLLVLFGLMDNYPEANARHYQFMLEGLKNTYEILHKRSIKLAVVKKHPVNLIIQYASDAATLICDKGYLKHQKQWRAEVASQCTCKIYQIETDVVVPVDIVSKKQEYAARTIRPKIHRRLEDFLDEPAISTLKHSSLNIEIKNELKLDNPSEIVKLLKLDHTIAPVSQFFKGGPDEAILRFSNFIDKHLKRYTDNRNQPQTDDISHMSPYLHFGQVSPAWLVYKVRQSDKRKDAENYIEELVVRRELAINFVNNTPDYDQYSSIPDWAQKTLYEHSSDKRANVYSLEELENCTTHDPYWNAAMKEMIVTGFMHNYMRMYWGKKILEWTEDPEQAYKHCLYLNNKYFLDGRDPNSFANVAWIFGMHDRPWGEFPCFGKVRTMKASGLKRKFDPELYIRKVDKLAEWQ